MRCKRPPEIKSWKNDSAAAAAVRLYDGRANESGKIGSAAAAAVAASDGRRITQLFIKTRLRKGGRERPKEPKFPSPSLPPPSVSQRVLQLVSHDDVDRLVQGSVVQREAVLRSPKFVQFVGFFVRFSTSSGGAQRLQYQHGWKTYK